MKKLKLVNIFFEELTNDNICLSNQFYKQVFEEYFQTFLKKID